MSEVTIKDVYELVDKSRKETAKAINKVNGDVTDVKVQVGKSRPSSILTRIA